MSRSSLRRGSCDVEQRDAESRDVELQDAAMQTSTRSRTLWSRAMPRPCLRRGVVRGCNPWSRAMSRPGPRRGVARRRDPAIRAGADCPAPPMAPSSSRSLPSRDAAGTLEPPSRALPRRGVARWRDPAFLVGAAVAPAPSVQPLGVTGSSPCSSLLRTLPPLPSPVQRACWASGDPGRRDCGAALSLPSALILFFTGATSLSTLPGVHLPPFLSPSSLPPSFPLCSPPSPSPSLLARTFPVPADARPPTASLHICAG